MMPKTVKILSPLVGIVFLVSGIGKAVAAYEFSQILTQYGFDALQYLAPLIIIVEITIGLLLFFYIRLKQTSLLALGFVTVLSLVFLYGLFFVNITDCGCFGHFTFLNTSPFFTIIRNLILTGILLFIFFKSDKARKATDKSEIIIMTCILCAVCFVTGYTYVESNDNTTKYLTKDIAIEKSELKDFFNPSKDSTYLVFAFSYSCPHCYNSIENLKQYERLKVVDKVIALTYHADRTTVSRFNALFQPNFQINNYRPEQLLRLTNNFPVSYYIKHNAIKMEIRGLLPCGYLLRQQLNHK